MTQRQGLMRVLAIAAIGFASASFAQEYGPNASRSYRPSEAGQDWRRTGRDAVPASAGRSARARGQDRNTRAEQGHGPGEYSRGMGRSGEPVVQRQVRPYGYDGARHGHARARQHLRDHRWSGRQAFHARTHYRPGARIPVVYRSRQYAVHDWHAHQLHAPRRGQQWVHVGPAEYALIAIATGVIVQLVLSY